MSAYNLSLIMSEYLHLYPLYVLNFKNIFFVKLVRPDRQFEGGILFSEMNWL